MSAPSTFVIVGASLAGAKAAETLRSEGFDGRVVLLGTEPERPYERPALSKDHLQGKAARGVLHVHEEGFYAAHYIELRTSSTVTAIDVGPREVIVDGREQVGFDRLLLATGAEPRRLDVPGSDLDGILYLRDLNDAEAIRQRMAPGATTVVIGAGWIGAEVAASLRQAGLDVTMVEKAQVPLERVLGPEVGAVYARLHREHGVDLRTGTGLAAFEGAGTVEHVVTTDGQRLECDFVVVGIGVVARTELAAAAGLDVDRGVLVDDRLQTSVPGIFAAGDVANARHPLYEGRLHVEHWANALHQGPTAARSMLGRDEAFDRIPYFFSDQFDLGMEYSGHAVAWEPGRLPRRSGGCLLDFNGRDRTWDCACHGSRFGVDGDVLHGPAKRALDVRRISVEATPDGDAA